PGRVARQARDRVAEGVWTFRRHRHPEVALLDRNPTHLREIADDGGHTEPHVVEQLQRDDISLVRGGRIEDRKADVQESRLLQICRRRQRARERAAAREARYLEARTSPTEST